MKRYVIERDLPGVGSMNREQLKGAATTSNGALAKLSGKAQWEHSYVVDDKTFCIYLADSEACGAGACQAERFPGEQGHGSAQRHRSDDGEFLMRRRRHAGGLAAPQSVQRRECGRREL